MIGERLAEIRKDHNDTQADLAEKLHVSIATVRGWEQERTEPSHGTLVTICQMYQISSDYLLGLSNTDPNYVQRRRLSHFSKAELDQLQDYEAYLRWKQKRPGKKGES